MENYYMTINDRTIINEYKNYLIKNIENSTDINKNIKSIDDIKNYCKEALLEFDKLEELDNEQNRYYNNYEEFRLAMDKIALGLNKAFKLKLSNKDKEQLSITFIELNNKFEVLFRKNIMKDVYVWK